MPSWPGVLYTRAGCGGHMQNQNRPPGAIEKGTLLDGHGRYGPTIGGAPLEEGTYTQPRSPPEDPPVCAGI